MDQHGSGENKDPTINQENNDQSKIDPQILETPLQNPNREKIPENIFTSEKKKAEMPSKHATNQTWAPGSKMDLGS